jgi:hypothetical protein
MLELTHSESIGSLRLRRYRHRRHGVVETLTQGTVVFVRPACGLLKPDEQQPPEVAEFRTQEPKKPKRARRLGGIWKAKRSAGGDA